MTAIKYNLGLGACLLILLQYNETSTKTLNPVVLSHLIIIPGMDITFLVASPYDAF